MIIGFLWALGAKLGDADIFFGPTTLMLPGADMLTLGDGVICGAGSAVLGSIIQGDQLIIAPVKIADQ